MDLHVPYLYKTLNISLALSLYLTHTHFYPFPVPLSLFLNAATQMHYFEWISPSMHKSRKAKRSIPIDKTLIGTQLEIFNIHFFSTNLLDNTFLIIILKSIQVLFHGYFRRDLFGFDFEITKSVNVIIKKLKFWFK